MRLDKWLKSSRLIARRTIAQLACEQGRVYVNNHTAKASTSLKLGDQIHIELGSRTITAEVLILPEKTPPAHAASTLYRLL